MATLATVSILFCDLVGSTDLLSRVGDPAADEVRRACFAAWRTAVAEHHGVEVKSQGDGLMVSFASAVDAVECGVALQCATHRLDGQRPGLGLTLRVGISSGEASSDEGDWFGTPVVEAARLCTAAAPGEVLASEIVATLVRHRSERAFHEVGPYALKGLPDPLRAVSFAWEHVNEPQTPLPRALAPADSLFSFFVGRGDDLERLLRGWKQVVAGDQRCWFIAGEPGIGKTTLVAEVARQAHAQGAAVLYGRCDQELSAPFQPFVEAIEGHLSSCPASVLATFSPERLGELTRLIPVLRELRGDLPVPPLDDPESERQRLFEAATGLFAEIAATQPLVLVLDDLHWATKPTLLLLRHLLLGSERVPILVLATYRDTDLSRVHPLAEMLADLRRFDVGRRITLRGFDRDEGTSFVEAAAGHSLDEAQQRLAEAIHEVTEGHPLFLREVLSHLAETGVIYQEDGRWVTAAAGLDLDRLGLPEGVREAISRRLSSLSDRTNDVLRAAAVVGLRFEAALVARLPELGLDVAEILDALDEALAVGLLAEGDRPGSYQFVHALVRQTLHDELTAGRRTRFHRRIAEAIEARADADDHVDLLAHHFAEAALDGGAEKAADHGLAAGRRAMERLAPEAAVGYAERALEVLDLAGSTDHLRRADLLYIVGIAHSESETARMALGRAADHARRADDVHRLADTAIALDNLTILGTEDPRTEELLVEVLDRAGDDDPTTRCRALAALARYRFRTRGEGRDLADRSLALARELGDDVALAEALNANLAVLHGTPHLDEHFRLLSELAEVSSRLERSPRRARGIWTIVIDPLEAGYRAMAWLRAGDRDEFERRIHLRARQVRRRFNNDRITDGLTALLDGRFAEAEDIIAGSLADENAFVGPLNNVLPQFLLLRRDQGRWGEVYDAMVEAAEANPTLVAFQAAVCAADAELGRPAAASARLQRLVADDLAAVPRDTTFPTSLSLLALAAASLGDRDASAVLLPHLVEYRGQVLVILSSAALGAADRYEAMLLVTLGRFDEAEERFESARALEQRIRSGPLVVRTDVAHAEMLLRRDAPGDCARARSLLDEARRSASEMGMAGIVRQADALLADLAT